jgi:hypothetical protein
LLARPGNGTGAHYSRWQGGAQVESIPSAVMDEALAKPGAILE